VGAKNLENSRGGKAKPHSLQKEGGSRNPRFKVGVKRPGSEAPLWKWSAGVQNYPFGPGGRNGGKRKKLLVKGKRVEAYEEGESVKANEEGSRVATLHRTTKKKLLMQSFKKN